MLFRSIVSKFLVNPGSTLRIHRSFYDARSRNQTIFAPATAIQTNKGSPLAIIRISGNRTRDVISNLTNLQVADDQPTSINSVTKFIRPREAKLSRIYNPSSRELIDIGILIWFPRPRSYTGEDVCELQVHGSQAIVHNLLDTLGRMDGLRPAEPGEFSRRAVENHRLSLIQAESISELISSKTDQQRRLALRGLTGSTRKRYDSWIENLIKILAHLEASIDFGEDELIGETLVVNECIKKIQQLSKDIDDFIMVSSRCRDLIQSGARVAILGRPNSGKSTFMNLLCRQEKSIVSDLAGTTRDVVEHSFELGGHTLTLSDTAGIKSSRIDLETNGTQTVIDKHNIIEMEGIKRALKAAGKAHLILYLFDANRVSNMHEMIQEIVEVFNNIQVSNQSRALQLIINKIDLANGNIPPISEEYMKTELGKLIKVDWVQLSTISCRTQENVNQLIESISIGLDRLQSSLSERPREDGNNSVESDYVNERHLSLLRSTQRHLDKAGQMNLRTIDEMAQHVRESVDYLSRIVGSVTNEQVLDIIFKDFCIGK